MAAPRLRAALRARAGEIARFGVVGILSTLVHMAVLTFGIEAGRLSLQLANAIAYAVALTVSYAGNKYWSFGSAGAHVLEVPRFLIVSLCGYLSTALILEIVVRGLGLHYLLGVGASLLIVPGQTYLLHAVWTFARR